MMKWKIRTCVLITDILNAPKKKKKKIKKKKNKKTKQNKTKNKKKQKQNKTKTVQLFCFVTIFKPFVRSICLRGLDTGEATLSNCFFTSLGL